MFDFIGFALTVLATLFILPIAALVKASRLRKRVTILENEIATLRRRLGDEPVPDPQEIKSEDDAATLEPDIEDDEPSDEDAESAIDMPPEQAAAGSDDKAGWRPQISLSSTGIGDSISGLAPTSGNMEQTIGTKWIVWIGGLALALGGIFMVRYTIEAGLLGPEVRVALGALFALLLAVAGEYIRRNDVTADLAGVPSAYIPGVLTAAGVLTGFATIYAAYALYGFLPPALAFILLAACSFASLSASWLHGPGLAALGLIGSYATPALVATQTPKAWPLFIYLLFVTGASYFAARLKGWLWLAVSATAGAVAWGLLWCAGNWSFGDIVPISFYILALMALSVYFLAYAPAEETIPNQDETKDLAFDQMDWVASGVLAAITFLVMPAVRLDWYSIPSLLLLGMATFSLLASAWHWRNLSVLIVWSPVLFGVIYLTWHIPQLVAATPFEAYLDAAQVAPPALWKFLGVGAVFAGCFAAAGFARTLFGGSHALWIYTSAITPIAIFAYAYLRATYFEQDVPFGIIGLLLAALYVGASDIMFRKGSEELWGWRSGCYAAAAVVTLALAFTILLEKGWLTIALALVCPGLGWVALKRPVPGLRYLAAGMAVVVMARLVFDPVIVGSSLGSTPILNWLLYGYGAPAAAFIGASLLFRQKEDDRSVQILEAAGILCVVALIGLQIRHLLNDGNVYSPTFDLAELAIHSISMLGLAIGLQRLYNHTNRITVEWAAAILGMAGLAAILLGHLLGWNPLFTGESVGENRFFNLLLLAYVVPALLCGVLYWLSYNRRPELYVKAIGATALLLILAYLSLENRALFHGSVLKYGITSDAEWYAYSAIGLLYGASLLGTGIATGLAAFRYASLAIIMMTITKVFLSDLSHLSGILRALSFIGLGLVLVGIGYFYQRFIFPQNTAEQEDTE